MAPGPAVPWRTLLVVGAVAVAVRLAFFTGFQNNDDRIYAEAAWDLIRGDPQVETRLFATRVGFTGPLALLFALFGARETCLVLPALAASLALVAMAWRMGTELASPAAGTAAALFVALLPLDVLYATSGFSDGLLAALMGGGVCLLLRTSEGPGAWALRAAAAGALWGAAHLTKESAILLLLPALPLVAGRERRRALGVALAVLAGVVLAEGCAYASLTGDFLHRFRLARSVQSGAGEAGSGLAGRLLSLPSFVANPLDPRFPYGGGLHAAALAGLALALLRGRPAARALGVWWLGSGLILELFPQSLVPFRPAVDVQPRMLLVMTLPGAALAGMGWSLVAAGARWPRWAAAAAAGVAMLGVVRLHADAVGWRRSLEWAHGIVAERAGAVVVTDPRAAGGLRFLGGYRGAYEVLAYDPVMPAPPPGTLLFRSGRHAEQSAQLDGIVPPPWWEGPEPLLRTTVAHRRWPAPWRLRGARGPEEEAALLRVEGSR